MALSGRAFFVVGALLLAANGAVASAIEDANSAVAAAREGKYDEAIELFTRAINSDALTLKARAQAYAYRGIAYATTGDYLNADDDLNASVVLGSDYTADALAFRGYFRLVQGRENDAVEDLAKSAAEKIWSYNAIWLHLARLKAGAPDTGAYSLANNAAMLELDRWPGSVIRYLMGQATPETVDAEAREGDPTRLVERVCDADFYVAEVSLAQGQTAAAKPRLERAASQCPFASFERMGAAAELMRLPK